MKAADLLRLAQLTLLILLALYAAFEAAQTLGTPRRWPALPSQSLLAAIGLLIVLCGARQAVLALSVALAGAGLASQAFQLCTRMIHELPGGPVPIAVIWACATAVALWLGLGRARPACEAMFAGGVTSLTVWLVAGAEQEATQISALAPAIAGIALATILRLIFDFRRAS